MDMQVIISQLAVLFIIIALGFAASKLKALPSEAGKVLTKTVLNVTLPCTMLFSSVGGGLEVTGTESFFFLLVSLLALCIASVIAVVASRLMRGNKSDFGLLACMTAFANVGFMGFPMAQAVFGPDAAFYVALNMIPFQLVSYSVGPLLISGKSGSFDPKVLITPALITSVCMIPLVAFGVKAPGIIVDVLRLTSSITTPCSMLIIGITLAQIPLKDIFSQWRLYPLTLIKLVIIPIATWLVLRLFITDTLMLGVLVVLSAMPTAAIVTMFAIEHKGNEHLASSGIFLTTLLSGLTVPFIVYLLFMR